MSKIEEAIAFAAESHAGQLRKGSSAPYIWHPLAVGRLLLEHGCDEPVIVAGILHDVTEDTPVTPEEVARRFGPRVRMIVDGCSEPDKSLSWEERKRHTIERIGSAPLDVRLVAAADKIDNLRSIVTDQARLGEAIWDRFRRGREQQEWYYRGVAERLGGGHALFARVATEVERVFGRQGD